MDGSVYKTEVFWGWVGRSYGFTMLLLYLLSIKECSTLYVLVGFLLTRLLK